MTTADIVAPRVLGLKVGDLVEVRSAEEIQATLDENGELDGLPFMPEMLAFCGRRLTVHKVAHKPCDNIAERACGDDDAVHLTESRCDGSAHGGCENACSLYWKEQWLKRVDPDDPAAPAPDAGTARLLPLLVQKTQKEPFEDGEARYSCQGTEMLRAAPERLLAQGPAPVPERTSTSGNAGVLAVLARSWSRSSTATRNSASGSCPASSGSGRPALGLPARAGSPAVARRPSTSTCSPASWSGSSRVRRSWRRWTRTC